LTSIIAGPLFAVVMMAFRDIVVLRRQSGRALGRMAYGMRTPLHGARATLLFIYCANDYSPITPATKREFYLASGP
jgi:hypothetical protein